MSHGINYQTFPKETSMGQRVTAVAPEINKLIDAHEDGSLQIGVEAFQDDILKRLEYAGLLIKKQWYSAENVGVHPDNRESTMLVPIDVHDLLKLIADDGWSWNKWDALACEVPNGDIGNQWRAKNVELTSSSDGLLPAYNADTIKIMTARGSHGTAAVRCMLLGAKGVHSEICANGIVSRSVICERQPSLAQPIDKGCPYDIVKVDGQRPWLIA